jgi:hypothetical protein
MSQISLSTCPICHAQNTLSYERMEFKGRSHEWYECTECGSALLWLGDDRWAYQKIGRQDMAHLLKEPMSEQELLALLPEEEEVASAPQAGDESAEVEEDTLTSLVSGDWPEYDEDPFAFLFRGGPEEEGLAATVAPEEEPAEEEPGPTPTLSEEATETAEPASAEDDEDWEEQEPDPFASLFEGEWEEEVPEEAGPTPVAEEEALSEEEAESAALFSRAWFEEVEAAEFTPATDEEISDLEDVEPGPGIGEDWPEQGEDQPALVAEEGQIELEEATFRPRARRDLPDEVERAITVSRDLPEPPRERSAVGRVIPWLLALCLIAFLFLIAVAVYQMVTGSAIF